MGDPIDPLQGLDRLVSGGWLQDQGNGRDPADGRKRPRYPSEAKRKKATYDLDPDTHAQIRDLARSLGIRQGDLVGRILAHGLAEIEAGRLEVKTK